MIKISAKTEYACIAVLELAAAFGSERPVRIGKIADRHGIPSRFLVQILLQLKGAGLVASTRGAAGGYRLVRPPQEVTLLDVMSVIDAQPEQVASSLPAETPSATVLLGAWQHVADVQRELLASTTFADLLEQAGSTREDMYYI